MGIFFKQKNKIVPVEKPRPGEPDINNFFQNKPTTTTTTIIVKPKITPEKLITKYICLVGNVEQNRKVLDTISLSFEDTGISKELLFNKIDSALIYAKQNYKDHTLTIFEVDLPESKLNSTDDNAKFFLRNFIKSTTEVQTREGKIVKKGAPEVVKKKILKSFKSILPGQYNDKSEVSMNDIDLSPESMSSSPPASPKRK